MDRWAFPDGFADVSVTCSGERNGCCMVALRKPLKWLSGRHEAVGRSASAPAGVRQTAHRSLVATLQAGLRASGTSKRTSMRRNAFPRLWRSGMCTDESSDGSRPGTSSHRCGGSAGFSPASRFIPCPANPGWNTCKVMDADKKPAGFAPVPMGGVRTLLPRDVAGKGRPCHRLKVR